VINNHDEGRTLSRTREAGSSNIEANRRSKI
jgi:hypothetical protein